MAALPPRAVSSFGRSVASGRVFARFEFKKEDIDPLVADLNYVTTPGVIESAGRIREAGEKVLAFLQANFPDRKDNLGSARVMKARKLARSGWVPAKRRPLRLKEGWRVNFYSAATINGKGISNGNTLLGFYIDHRQAERARIRTILASLESGSRPYTIYPKRKKSLFFASGGEGVAADSADIPARKGFGYMRKTEVYADSLLAAHGSMLENELQRIIEKGQRLKVAALGAGAKNEPTSAVSDALDALGDETANATLSGAKSPLKAIKTLKNRVRTRRFLKSYR